MLQDLDGVSVRRLRTETRGQGADRTGRALLQDRKLLPGCRPESEHVVETEDRVVFDEEHLLGLGQVVLR